MDRWTKVGLLQLDPVFKSPEESIKQANELIASLSEGEIDLLILPELAFTGYNFKSYEDIEEFVESEVDGLSTSWAKSTAKKLKCHVMVGFPQRIQSQEDIKDNQSERPIKKCYNALSIVSDSGELLKVYHKTQLYPPVDPLWAKAGDGFLMINLNIGKRRTDESNRVSRDLVRCCIGICMDLSPDKFEAPFDRFELASFAINNNCEVLICSMAWLDSVQGVDPNRTDHGKSWNEVKDTLNYWALRCTPIWKAKDQTFIACNRVGKEDGTVFTGTSCVISNHQSHNLIADSNRPTVLDYASKHKPELLLVDVPLSSCL
ncbi:carbon-nitrogen hydrolase [Phakopsora pachyrhizi]|nr:carbon-nitrogen hydrolase [Phakopsora pachyrhizi]